MEEFTPLQRRLMLLRDKRCGGNAAEMARQIKKDPTYVNRLFYPATKRGAKGIGLEIMNACTAAFNLPAGYWDGILAYWPFSDELQEAVSALDVDANFRLENVIRAHLGMETLHKLAPQELPNGALAETIEPALRQNIPTGSAARSGLTVVQPDNRPAPHTPALDAEDARHRRQDSYAGGSHRSPAGPKGNGDPH